MNSWKQMFIGSLKSSWKFKVGPKKKQTDENTLRNANSQYTPIHKINAGEEGGLKTWNAKFNGLLFLTVS